jgi:hypothetical protein
MNPTRMRRAWRTGCLSCPHPCSVSDLPPETTDVADVCIGDSSFRKQTGIHNLAWQQSDDAAAARAAGGARASQVLIQVPLERVCVSADSKCPARTGSAGSNEARRARGVTEDQIKESSKLKAAAGTKTPNPLRSSQPPLRGCARMRAHLPAPAPPCRPGADGGALYPTENGMCLASQVN